MEERDRCYSFIYEQFIIIFMLYHLEFLEVWGGFREGPGQEYSKPASVYEKFDESARSERCV
jgi:hypothetical protein